MSAEVLACGALVTFKLTQGYVALVDAEDYDRLSAYKWSAKVKEDGRVYAQASILRNGKKTTMLMHRFLLDAPRGVQVDHRNNLGTDNFKANLRLCDGSQNNQNSCPRKKRVTATFKGVWRSKDRAHFRAAIKIHGRQIHLGMFQSEDAAARAYDAAAIQHFGEFARTNFPSSPSPEALAGGAA